jgi:hypothetical protein
MRTTLGLHDYNQQVTVLNIYRVLPHQSYASVTIRQHHSNWSVLAVGAASCWSALVGVLSCMFLRYDFTRKYVDFFDRFRAINSASVTHCSNYHPNRIGAYPVSNLQPAAFPLQHTRHLTPLPLISLALPPGGLSFTF